MINPKLLLAASALALSAALPRASSAQPGTEAPPQDAVFFVASGSAVMPFGGQVDVIGREGSVIGGVVKGKPYTADSVTESTQVLADGNRIVNRNEARMYRDSQGRTRLEQTLNGLGVWQTANEPLTIIKINDPVADTSYIIDPVRRTARKLQPFRLALDGNATWTQAVPAPLPKQVGTAPIAGRQVVVEQGVVTSDVIVGSSSVAPAPFELPLPPPGGGVAIRGAATGFGEPGVKLDVRRFDAGPVTAALGLAGGQMATEDLGEQVLEGVLARGTRQTQTIPAGTIGNERAIAIVAEQWYSQEIEAVVLRRNTDPRFGETSYRLANLVRAEPAPDLFAVPQGYELQTEPAFPASHVEMRALSPGEAAAGNEPPAGARAQRRVFLVQPETATAPAK